MDNFGLVLWIFALVFFAIASGNWAPEPNRTRLIAIGLACIAAAQVFVGGVALFKNH